MNDRPRFIEPSKPLPRAVKVGGSIAATGAAVAVVVLIIGMLFDVRGTAGKVLFGLILTGFGLLIVGAVIAAAAGRTPPASPEEARQRRSFAMIVFGALALIFGFLGLSAGAPVGVLFALLGVGLLVGGLVIRR
jgi:hypothetical protein